jgi:hypothetical protein
MSRWLALVALVACSGAQAPSQRSPSATATVRARIVDDSDGSWIDITTTGDQAAARCDQLANRSLQVTGRLARPCAPAALPPVGRASAALLVETEHVDAASQIATHRPYPDRGACDRARAQLVAADTQRREDAERARVLDLERRIHDATDARDRACGAVAEEDARCATRKGDERAQCSAAVEPKRMVCRDATRRRDELDRPAAAPPPMAERGCMGTGVK